MTDSSVAVILVLLAHLWGDFVFQSDHQAAHKAGSWRAMAGHMVAYHVPMAAVAVWVWGLHWRAVVFLAVSAVTHALVDRVWPVTFVLRVTRSPGFARTALGIVATDQILHLTILYLMLFALA